MEDEEEAAKRARLSADNDSAMGDLDPRTRPAVPGSSCEYCIEKVRLESEMLKSRVKLEGLLKLSKTTTTQLRTQRSTRPTVLSTRP
ncbi:hypothetical protein AVEN_178740-1 [Araneus ventricosus]|uniref:Uncharacterized protein n=1 Tax=Araneus ventricosus TaxID=182803 RepID=A0A4Y2HXG6_ARAVE|nr:hypothetical protein AVEN_274877-1 [Araneus ventricosus]GBM69734.1 hypothetical protein AVEN_178740-1 [Araneus ventricosus]